MKLCGVNACKHEQMRDRELGVGTGLVRCLPLLFQTENGRDIPRFGSACPGIRKTLCKKHFGLIFRSLVEGGGCAQGVGKVVG